MASFIIEPGKNILCKELNTGKASTGFFYLDDKTHQRRYLHFVGCFYGYLQRNTDQQSSVFKLGNHGTSQHIYMKSDFGPRSFLETVRHPTLDST